MGKIRTELIKRSAAKIIETYPNSFSTDFEANKKRLLEVASIPSKKIRNQVAGYITRIKKREAQFPEYFDNRGIRTSTE